MAVVARRCLEAKKGGVEGRKRGDEKEKRVETTKGWVGGQAKTATSDSSKQQRQHDSRWLARHCSLPALYFFPSHPPHVLQRLLSHLVLLALSCPREREARTMGFIVFELGASLLCFVSRAIRGANCRSYAIAFCFLLLPPSLHALSFSLAVSLFSCSGTAPVRPRFPLVPREHPDRHHRPRRRAAES